MEKPTYVGVFLDRASRELLLARFPPAHPKVFADHLTLAFGKAMAFIEKDATIGKVISLKVIGSAKDEKGQAAACSFEGIEQLISPHQTPHITVSCAEGVPPKYSNELLNRDGIEHAEPFTVTGVIDFFPRTLKEESDVPAFGHCGSDVRH